MAKYLIDVNLPYHFGLWNTSEYIHQADVNPLAKDKIIWEYAKENSLTIITKDSDFSNRILFKDPPPKVIHIKIGNVSMKEFHRLINSCWEDVVKMSESHKLVNVYKDKIEGVK